MGLHEYPCFDTRSDAENYAETLRMRGYERSMGYEVLVDRSDDGDGYEVRIQHCRPDLD